MNLNRLEAIALALCVVALNLFGDGDFVASLGIPAAVVHAVMTVAPIIIGFLKPIVQKDATPPPVAPPK